MNILVADDDRTSLRMLVSVLKRWGHDVSVAEDGMQAWHIIQERDIQIVISDWVMPETDGPGLCRLIRGANLPRYVYIFLLTTKGERQDIIEGLSAGADDYLVKPFDHAELQVRLRAGARIIELERSLLEAQEKLEFLATTDELTGLLNRRELLNRLDLELDRSVREQCSLAVIMADIDHFKQVNDTHGHAAGDEVLQRVSLCMNQAIRPYDLVGRFGGEEFLIVLPQTRVDTAYSIAERIRRAISGLAIPIGEKVRLRITASFGVTVSIPGRAVDRDLLIALADKALYQAKSTGRNRTSIRNGRDEGFSVRTQDPKKRANDQ